MVLKKKAIPGFGSFTEKSEWRERGRGKALAPRFIMRNAYHLSLGTANVAAVVIFVSAFLLCSRTDFVWFGPSEHIVFAGYAIDTWER